MSRHLKEFLGQYRLYQRLAKQYMFYQLKYRIRKARPVKVVLGAGRTRYAGWITTDAHILDITCETDWARLFKPASIDRLLMEHVLEHLDETGGHTALKLCYHYLKPGAILRIAVPDGYRDDDYYLKHVSPPADGHKILFTIDSLAGILESVGFKVQPLEYYAASHQFHIYPWDEADGYVRRSSKFDRRVEFQRDTHFYTSLIVDAVK